MIKNFKDLNAWKEAHKLVLLIYKLSEKFPKKENFALSNQVTRAAVSITSNIAEGFARNSSKDKIQFYTIARGSLSELESQFVIAKDLGYIEKDELNNLEEKIVTVSKLISGLIKSAPTK